MMNEAVGLGSAHRLLVQAHCFGFAALDSGYLGTDQGGSALKISGTIPFPGLERGVMSIDRVQMLGFTIRAGTTGRQTQRSVEMKFGGGEFGRECPCKPFCLRQRIARGRVVPGNKASLQQATPVDPFQYRQIKITSERALGCVVLGVLLVKGGEGARVAPQRPNVV